MKANNANNVDSHYSSKISIIREHSMDKDTKNFFEKLAGVKSNGKDIEIDLDPKILDQEDGDESEKGNSIGGMFDEPEGELALDVYQTPGAFVIESAIAGVNPEDIDVSITPESINIKGKRVKEEKVKTENYIHQECFWGKFSRSIILPQEVDPDKAQAGIKNGVLKITLPR